MQLCWWNPSHHLRAQHMFKEKTPMGENFDFVPPVLSSWHSFLPFSTTIIHSKASSLNSIRSPQCFFWLLGAAGLWERRGNMGGFSRCLWAARMNFQSSPNALRPSHIDEMCWWVWVPEWVARRAKIFSLCVLCSSVFALTHDSLEPQEAPGGQVKLKIRPAALQRLRVFDGRQLDITKQSTRERSSKFFSRTRAFDVYFFHWHQIRMQIMKTSRRS